VGSGAAAAQVLTPAQPAMVNLRSCWADAPQQQCVSTRVCAGCGCFGGGGVSSQPEPLSLGLPKVTKACCSTLNA
jgi:hypothetical protein